MQQGSAHIQLVPENKLAHAHTQTHTHTYLHTSYEHASLISRCNLISEKKTAFGAELGFVIKPMNVWILSLQSSWDQS